MHPRTGDLEPGHVVWVPPADARQRFVLGRHLSDLVWDFFETGADAPYERVPGADRMPRPEWFSGARLNYAADTVGSDKDTNAIAIVARSQSRGPVAVNFGELRDQVARARVGLQRLGIGPGARVAACLPNIPETLVALLATASRGAVRATCAPEFGPRSVLDHLGRLEPTLLLALAGYRWGDRLVDRRDRIAVRAGLPSLRAVVHVPCADGNCNALPDMTARGELSAEPGPPEFDPAAFAHPGCALTICLGDVARARLGAAHPLLDLDDRPQPDLAGPRLPVAPGRGDRSDVLRAQPGVHDVLPQGRADADGRHGSFFDPRAFAWPDRPCRAQATSDCASRSARRGSSTSAAEGPTSAPGSSRAIRCFRAGQERCRRYAWASMPPRAKATATRSLASWRARDPVSDAALVSPASIEPFTAYAAQHATPSEKGERTWLTSRSSCTAQAVSRAA